MLLLLQLNDEQRYWCVARTLLNWKIEGALTNRQPMAFADAEQPGSVFPRGAWEQGNLSGTWYLTYSLRRMAEQYDQAEINEFVSL